MSKTETVFVNFNSSDTHTSNDVHISRNCHLNSFSSFSPSHSVQHLFSHFYPFIHLFCFIHPSLSIFNLPFLSIHQSLFHFFPLHQSIPSVSLFFLFHSSILLPLLIMHPSYILLLVSKWKKKSQLFTDKRAICSSVIQFTHYGHQCIEIEINN